MDFAVYLILGIALGVWACVKQVRDEKRKQQRASKAKPVSHSSKYTTKSDSDGYTRVFDRFGNCVYESPDKADAMA